MRLHPSLILLALLLAAACTSTKPPLPVPTPTDAPLFGAVLYAQRCALCHSEQGEGRGKVGPSLRSPGFLATASDTYLTQAIAVGRPGTTMSPWRQNGLSDEQIASLVTYLRTWQTRAPVTLTERPAQGNTARGQALYAQLCAACHGPEGRSGRDPNYIGTELANPTFLAQASDTFIAYAITHGRSGTVMPAFSDERGGSLDPRAIEDIVTFIRSWQK
jgi:cytochrome c oxidase cbb3-type subunit III